MLPGRVLALDPLWGSRLHQRRPSSFLRIPEAGDLRQPRQLLDTYSGPSPRSPDQHGSTCFCSPHTKLDRTGTSCEGQLGMLVQPSWDPAMCFY